MLCSSWVGGDGGFGQKGCGLSPEKGVGGSRRREGRREKGEENEKEKRGVKEEKRRERKKGEEVGKGRK